MRANDLFALNAETARRRPTILITDMASGAQRLVHPEDVAHDPLGDVLRERFESGASGLVATDGAQLFIQVHAPSLRLVVIGAVQIAQVLAPMARLAGLEVTVVGQNNEVALRGIALQRRTEVSGID